MLIWNDAGFCNRTKRMCPEGLKDLRNPLETLKKKIFIDFLLLLWSSFSSSKTPERITSGRIIQTTELLLKEILLNRNKNKNRNTILNYFSNSLFSRWSAWLSLVIYRSLEHIVVVKSHEMFNSPRHKRRPAWPGWLPLCPPLPKRR